MKYDALIQTIHQVHTEAKASAAGAVNRHLVLRNWLIGAYIVEYEQGGNDRADYGAGLLNRIAKDLKKKDIPGCSTHMLGRMRLLFRKYPQIESAIPSSPMREFPDLLNINSLQISSSPMLESTQSNALNPQPLPTQAVLRFSWTHLIELIAIDAPWKRAFYENECLNGNWSVRQLQRQIGSLLYERSGLSADKETVIDAGRNQTIEAPQTVDSLIRDPYILEFTGLAEKPHYLEKDLEAAKSASPSATNTTTSISFLMIVSRYLVALPIPEELEALIENDQAVFEEQASYNANHVAQDG